VCGVLLVASGRNHPAREAAVRLTVNKFYSAFGASWASTIRKFALSMMEGLAGRPFVECEELRDARAVVDAVLAGGPAAAAVATPGASPAASASDAASGHASVETLQRAQLFVALCAADPPLLVPELLRVFASIKASPEDADKPVVLEQIFSQTDPLWCVGAAAAA
jgi:hypothetical protein